jgi:hypothetical protein
MQFDIFGLLPAFMWEGPPLPRFLGITWQSLFGQTPPLPSVQSQHLALPQPTEFIKSVGETLPKPSTLYSNIEQVEFPDGFDPDTFMPKKIVIHRKTETR